MRKQDRIANEQQQERPERSESDGSHRYAFVGSFTGAAKNLAAATKWSHERSRVRR